jgi:hypothetical protein
MFFILLSLKTLLIYGFENFIFNIKKRLGPTSIGIAVGTKVLYIFYKIILDNPSTLEHIQHYNLFNVAIMLVSVLGVLGISGLISHIADLFFEKEYMGNNMDFDKILVKGRPGDQEAINFGGPKPAKPGDPEPVKLDGPSDTMGTEEREKRSNLIAWLEAKWDVKNKDNIQSAGPHMENRKNRITLNEIGIDFGTRQNTEILKGYRESHPEWFKKGKKSLGGLPVKDLIDNIKNSPK